MGEITITRLAEMLGIGKSTVQRVLSGSGKVSPKTRERVLKVAEEAGYQRNLYFSALATQRRRTNKGRPVIHYINRNLPRANPESMGVREADVLGQFADRMGIELKIADPALVPHPRQLARMLWHQGSAGFLLGNCGSPFIDGLEAVPQLPILNLMTTNALPYHRIGFDVSKAVQMCWQKLRERGYRRIGCAVMQHNPVNYDDLLRRGAALVEVAKESAEEDRIPLLVECLPGNEAYINWLKNYRPDAVIGFSTGGYWQCREIMGRQVPYVALHTGQREESRFVPGVIQPLAVHAQNAIRLIDAMMRNADCGIPEHRYSLLIDPVWHAGEGF